MQGSPADLLPYAALLLVVIGWFVANHQANCREGRKEARALVDSAKGLARQVAVESIRYMCDGDRSVAVSIKGSLDELEIELGRLPNFSSNASPLLGRLVEFQDAVTGGDFETTSPAIRDRQSKEVANVLRARNELMAELERQFRVHYLGQGSTRL